MQTDEKRAAYCCDGVPGRETTAMELAAEGTETELAKTLALEFIVQNIKE